MITKRAFSEAAELAILGIRLELAVPKLGVERSGYSVCGQVVDRELLTSHSRTKDRGMTV